VGKETTTAAGNAPLDKLTVSQLLTAVSKYQRLMERDGLAFEYLTKLSMAAGNPENTTSVPGLPILSWTASLGGEKVNIETDLAKVEVTYLTHVLNPLCNSHAAAMRLHLAKIPEINGELEKRFTPPTKD